MYKVFIEKQVLKNLEKISEPDYSKIKKAILDLAVNPRPPRFKQLKGRDGFRIRQGNYRIIYEINDKRLLVYVLLVRHRKDVYK